MEAKGKPQPKLTEKALYAGLKAHVDQTAALYFEQYKQLYGKHIENAKDGARLRAALEKCLELEKAGYKQDMIRRALCGLKLSFAPTTTQRLSPKLREFEQDPLKATLDKRRLRIEREPYKIEGEVGKWLISFYAQSPIISYNQTFYDYQNERQLNHPEWPEIKDSKTIATYLKTQKFVWMAAKYSQKVAEDSLLPIHSLRAASFSDALWTMDGTTIDLQAIDYQTGKPLPALYVYWIADSHSRAILAMDFDFTETAALVQRTIKEAIRTTGYKPHQVKYDRGRANNAVEVLSLLDKITPRHFPTKAYSGRSKRIERIIQEVQRLIKTMPNSTGGNITAHTLPNKANSDKLMALLKAGNLPDYEGIKAQMRLIVDVYNKQPRRNAPSRWEVYCTPHEKRMSVAPTDYAELFLTKRRDKTLYTNKGLVIELDGVPTAYTVKNERGELDAYFLRQYQGQRFEVHCDRDNPDWVALYLNDKQVAIASLKMQYAEALVDKLPGEDALRHADTETAKALLETGREQYRRIEAETGAKLSFQMLSKDLLNAHESTLKMPVFTQINSSNSGKATGRKTPKKVVGVVPAVSAEERGMNENVLHNLVF